MNSNFIKYLSCILCLILSSSCDFSKNYNAKNSAKKISNSYAKGFSIIAHKDYTELKIYSPNTHFKKSVSYFFSTNNQNPKIKTIKIPVKSVVVTSTTHLPMLELLHGENNLVGFPNTKYISSEKILTRIKLGKVLDLGNEEHMNTELLMNLKPDIVIGFSLNSNNKMYQNIKKMGINVIINNDWLEANPLARAEWIKVFGLLFNKNHLADSIFKTIESNYLTAKKLAKSAKKIPTVISGGLFKNIWYLPAGKSFEATFLNDANTNYLYKNTSGTGSLSLNIESVYVKGKNANIWLSPSYFTSYQELANSNVLYTKFKAFKQKQIYSYVINKGKSGGIVYFELAPTRPDLVLKDLIKIAHPSLLPNYKLTFYRRLK
ncbi:MAG: ABC transporter substrate-binding protein [Lutibacter sp.]